MKHFIKLNRHLFEAVVILLIVGIILFLIFLAGGTQEDITKFFYFYGFVSLIVLIKQVTFTPIKWK